MENAISPLWCLFIFVSINIYQQRFDLQLYSHSVDPLSDLIQIIFSIPHVLVQSVNMHEKGAKIRDFLKPGDIGYLTYLQGKQYYEEFGFNIEFEALIARLFNEYIDQRTEKKGIWIVEYKGKPIGCVALFRETDEEGRLRLLFVHPDHRREGLGSKLVDKVLSTARGMGYSRIYLSTESLLKDALGLYRRAGFVLKEEYPVRKWGRDLIHQGYELEL